MEREPDTDREGVSGVHLQCPKQRVQNNISPKLLYCALVIPIPIPTLDAVGVAQGLSLRRAVDFGDQFARLVARKGFHELVPVRGNFFAVAAPRRVELEEHGLARGHVIEVVRGKMHGRGAGEQGEGEDAGEHFES